MGIVRMGSPEELILRLLAVRPVNIFVETGTFLGGTTQWASIHFEKVITLEAAQLYFDKAQLKFAKTRNVSCLYGDSRSQMGDIVKTLHEPAIFWLDSHWCGSESYGENNQCPLLEEIEVINTSTIEHLILIDDARLFTSPPPLPNRIAQWPTIAEVCRLLDAGTYHRYVVIFEDVIIAVPKSYRDSVAIWCQDANTRAWQDHGEQIKRTRFQKGLGNFKEGIRLIAEGAKGELNKLVRRA